MNNKFYIGRDPKKCQIVFDDNNVSRVHAILEQLPGDVLLLTDNNSTVGTYVNGRKISSKKLEPNDKIRLGDHQVSVEALKNILRSEGEDYSREFLDLKKEYVEYNDRLEKIIRKYKARSLIIRALLSLAVIALVFYILINYFHINIPGMYPLALVMMSFSALLPTKNVKRKEEIEWLNDEFKSKYCCPNIRCQMPFHNQSWDLLKKQQGCKYCEAKW